MGIPTDEQETVIQFSRNSKVANVWTSDFTVMTKLDKLVASEECPYELKDTGYVNGEVVNKEYTLPKSLLSFRKQKQKQNLTPEGLEKRINALKAYRESTKK